MQKNRGEMIFFVGLINSSKLINKRYGHIKNLKNEKK